MEQNEKRGFISFRMILLIAVLGVILIAMMFYSFHKGLQVYRVYVPWVKASMEVKLAATTAHLWFEEVLSGDRPEDMEPVWTKLNHAAECIQDLLEGGKKPDGVIHPLNEETLCSIAGDAGVSLAEFREVTRERWADRESQGRGTEVYGRYHALFSSFLGRADDLAIGVRRIVEQDSIRFYWIQAGLIFSFVMMALFIGITFVRFERGRARDYRALHEAKGNLEREMAGRRRADEKARVTEIRYGELYEGSRDGYAMVNMEGRILESNSTFRNMLGYRSEELAEKKYKDIIPEKWHALEAEILEKEVMTRGYSDVYEKEYIREDGTVFPIEIRTHLSKDEHGEPIGMWAFVRDITERKIAEDALKKSEATLNSIFKAAPTGIGLVSNRVLLDVNDRICEMLGYSRHELVDQNARILYPTDEDYEFVGREKYRQISVHGTGTVETRWQHKGGRVIDVLLSSTPLDPADLSKGVTFTALDITERNRAERALRESEERYALAVRGSTDGLWDTDIITGDVFYTDRFKELLGYKPDQFPDTRQAFFDFIHPDDVEAMERATARHLKYREPYDVEYRVRTKSEDYRWFQARGQAIWNEEGKATRMAGSIQDITDRKQAEEALRQSEEQYRTLFESANDAIFLMEGDRFMECNHKTLEMFGCTMEQIIGETPYRFSPPYQPDGLDSKEKALQKISNALSGDPQFFEWRHWQYDETPFDAEVSLNCVEIADKRVLLAMVRDISERKRAEEEVRLRQQQLIQADKMISLGILVSGVAHEINNPNHFIMSNASPLVKAWNSAEPVLDRYYKENGDFAMAGMDYSEARAMIPGMFSSILEGSKRIKSIVDELRAYARERPAELRDYIQLNHVVRSAVTLLSNMLSRSTRRFSLEIQDDLPTVEGNYQRLEQVVINLIQNACQALPDKEKGVMVSTLYDPDQRIVLLEVTDEGMGIPPEDLGHITDPFFTTKRESGGTGLGLSISSSIILEHGGELTFFSSPDEGTRATVKLPVKETADPPGRVEEEEEQ